MLHAVIGRHQACIHEKIYLWSIEFCSWLRPCAVSRLQVWRDYKVATLGTRGLTNPAFKPLLLSICHFAFSRLKAPQHHSPSQSSFLDSWGKDKLESKSELHSLMTSSSSFSMNSLYIGRFIAHAGWHAQCASWTFCCLLPNSKLWNTPPMFVLSIGTTGIGFNFAIAERSIASSGMG